MNSIITIKFNTRLEISNNKTKQIYAGTIDFKNNMYASGNNYDKLRQT